MERNDMSELDVLVIIEHQLACHQWNDMFELLADTSVMIYPQVDDMVNNRDRYPVLSKLAVLISQCKTQAKGSLDTYSPKILRGYLYGRIRNSYNVEDLKSMAKYFIAIKELKEDAQIVLDEEWANILSSPLGVPMPSAEENHLKPSQSIQEDKELSQHPVERKISHVAKTANEMLLERFWNKLTSGRFDYQYFWRNKISAKQYHELKSLIKTCTFENKRGFEKRFGRAIALCIAEWYKREYNGNDGKSNAVKELNLSCRPKDVWEYSGLPDNFLYGQQNKRYLDSLYVLGGLPINYLVGKRFNDVFKEIQSVYKQKEDDETLQGNVFINNNTLQESTRSQWGSLHMYFDALMSDDYPFADEDKEEEPFRTFIENLQKWNPMRKKFSIEWLVEGNQDVEIFRRQMRLYVMPENNGERNKSVSYGRVSRWGSGITTKTKLFRVYALFNNMSPVDIVDPSECITFYNTYDGFFVGRLRHNYFTFNNLPTGNIYKVTLFSEVDGFFKEFYSIEVNPWLQLYETNRYSVFSSRKTDGQSYALLPYEKKVNGVKDDEYEKKFFAADGDPYKLIPINGSISFEAEEGEEIYMVSKDHDIEISVKPHNNLISYLKGDLCKRHYFSDDNEEMEENVPVILSRNDLHFTLYEENRQPKTINSEDIRLEYKKIEESHYHQWEEGDYPIGMIKIKATYENETISSQETVYSICSPGESISRDCSNNTISFNENIPLKGVPSGLKMIDSHSYEDDKNYDRSKDSFVFEVGSDEDYIELPIYRAFNAVELFRDGEFFKYGSFDHSTKVCVRVPFLLKNHFSLRMVGDKIGVVRLNLKESKIDYLNFEFEDDEDPMGKKIDIEPIVSFVYDSELSIGMSNNINITSSEIDQYRFYYWSMEGDSLPRKIELQPYEGSIQLILSEEEKRHGMIFQSLEDDVCPGTYFAPIINGKWGDTRHQETIREKCFVIAACYKTPFRIFPPIYSYLKGTDSALVDLAARYLFPIDKKENSSEDAFQKSLTLFLNKFSDNEEGKVSVENIFIGHLSLDDRFKALIRFSHEMYFSWIFLNRRTWKEMPNRFIDSKYVPLTINSSKNDPFISKALVEMFYKGDSGHLTMIKEYLRKCASRLFMMCGIRESGENYNSLRNITKAYWGHQTDKGYRFPAFNSSWYGYDAAGIEKKWNDRKNDLPEKAVCFMRPKPLRRTGIGIIGFTDLENAKHQGEEVRNIKDIIDFLRKLYANNNSFIEIEQFLIKNLYTYNAH